MNFLRGAAALNTSAGPNPDGKTPGVSLDPLTGQFTMTGNVGTVNDIQLDASDIRVLDSSGAFVRAPFIVDKDADATGESVRTSFIVYDSLGSPITADLTMVLDSKGNTGTGWRYFVDSADDTDLSANVATGLMTFDTEGPALVIASDPHHHRPCGYRRCHTPCHQP
jgi:flagellar hook protein FlgE